MQHLDAFVFLTWLAAAKCYRCSRRFSGSIAAAMCLRFWKRFKRFAAVGGPDGVLRGFGEWLYRRGPKRSVLRMLNRRDYTRNGHDWNQNQNQNIRSYYRPRRPLLRPYLVAIAEATWKKNIHECMYVKIILINKSKS